MITYQTLIPYYKEKYPNTATGDLQDHAGLMKEYFVQNFIITTLETKTSLFKSKCNSISVWVYGNSLPKDIPEGDDVLTFKITFSKPVVSYANT